MRTPTASHGLRILLATAISAVAACAGPPRPGLASDLEREAFEVAGRRSVRVGLVVRAPRTDFVALVESRADTGERLAPGTYSVAREGTAAVLTDARQRVVARTAGTLVLQPSVDEGAPAWGIGDDRFAGSLSIVASAAGVSLVNRLDIETYLRGVVPWEIGRPGEEALEAVKAQAIAARTYTYAHLDHWSELGFDLYADTRDQVYRGLTGTAPITDRAVRETEHRVGVHDGRLIRAYYSSTCGGHGATLTDVWTREGAEYLRGRPDRGRGDRAACIDSPQFRWVETWSARELGEIVREHLPAELGRSLGPWDIGVLRRLSALERDASGRVRRLVIETDRDRFEVFGDRIRWVLRPARGRFGILRSTLLEIENVERDGRLVGVIVRGGGFGHGVGLCQTGALGRARAGEDAEEILRAYYAGVEVVDVRRARAAR